VSVSPRSLPLENCTGLLSAFALPPMFWNCWMNVAS
jgi:hypothetical protein